MTAVQKDTIQYSVIGSKIKESIFNKILGHSTRQLKSAVGPSAQFALSSESYPFVVSGSCGSGRRQVPLNLAINNIQHGSPFVFIDGSGDTSPYWELYAAAKKYDNTENLYIINTLASSYRDSEETSKLSHTFDPLNSLIGNEQAFSILFGCELGNLIHSLCQCKKEAGEKVSFDDLSNYINLRWLKKSAFISYYRNAQSQIQGYLGTYGGDKEHFINASKAMYFRDAFEHSACYSIAPEIDFDEIYKKGKYLHIMLPALEKDPEALNVYATTMLLLLEQSRVFQKADGLPTEFIQDVVAYSHDTKFFIESPKKALTIYAISYFKQSPRLNYFAHEQISERARSFLFMKQEEDIPQNVIDQLAKLNIIYPEKHQNGNNVFPFNNFNARKFLDNLGAFHPFEGMAFGKIELLKHSESCGVIEEPQAIKVPCKALFDLNEEDNISVQLSRKPLLNKQ